jgi:hypothetical protein
MRSARRKAWAGLLVTLGAGLVMALAMLLLRPAIGDWALWIGIPAFAIIPLSAMFTLLAGLAALGEVRLRRGIGALARWTVPPADWEAFRALDARRTADAPDLRNDLDVRPAEGRTIEVLFGRLSVIVDDSYHPLRRFAVPELRWVGWLEPKDAPECLEFGLAALSDTRVVPSALRVPVPRAAREDGVRIYRHFNAMMPKGPARQGLAFRRPRLVFGGCLAVAAVGAAIAGIGWWLQVPGQESEAAVITTVVGIAVVITALLVFAIVGLFVLGARRRKARG